MDTLTELFLPTSLPPWARYLVVGFVCLHVLGFAIYGVYLCRECAQPRESYPRVKLAKE